VHKFFQPSLVDVLNSEAFSEQMLDAGYSMLDTRYLILDAGYSILDSRYLILDAGYSMLDNLSYIIGEFRCHPVVGWAQPTK